MTSPADAPHLELTVAPVAHGGHFVGRHEGRVIFVRHALPGERVRVRLTEYDGGAKFWRGDVTEVLEASTDRRDHVWDQADALAAATAGTEPLGGAEFGHIDLAAQRRLKTDIVTEQLQRLGGIDAAERGFAGVEAAPGEDARGLGWRTRLAFAVTTEGRLAMHPHRSAGLVAVTGMPLASAEIQRLGPWGADYAGFERVEIAAPAGSEQALVLLVPTAELDPAAARRAALAVAEQLPEQASVALLTQGTGAAADGAGTLQRVTGRGWLSERVHQPDGTAREYRVTGEGFWQIHRSAPAALTEAVLRYVDPQPGQRIADLYAGAGLFTLPLAEAVGEHGRVLSIEGAPGTSKDAKRNLHEHRQAVIARGRVERTLRAQAAQHGHASPAVRGRRGGRLDAVVLDPPRAGAGRAGVEQIARTTPQVVGYVSCDPASFARDAADFERRGYRLEAVRALDLYPNTHHVETIGRFVRV